MTYYDYIILVTAGTMIFYAVEIVEKGRSWLRAASGAKGNRWLRLLKQCAIWIVLIWLSSCVFAHLVLASLHSAA